MFTRTQSIVLATMIGGGATFADAAIRPHWRQNPIPPAVTAINPYLMNAISMSLLVDLTDGSLFNAAGLDLTELYPGAQYFNSIEFVVHGLPHYASPILLAAFPDLAFDTYVRTTTEQFPAVPGRLNGTESAVVGHNGMFNVAWGAMPNTGPTGGVDLEIARITFMNVTSLPPLPIPLSAGHVRDNLNPNVAVPIPAFPEPSICPLVAAAALWMRRTSSTRHAPT